MYLFKSSLKKDSLMQLHNSHSVSIFYLLIVFFFFFFLSKAFDYEFNKPIEALSGLLKLEHLTFGDKFNQQINSLSGLINLKHLTFGDEFNKSQERLKEK